MRHSLIRFPTFNTIPTSPAACTASGYNPKEMIGDSLSSLHGKNKEKLPHEGELRRVAAVDDNQSAAFVLPLAGGYECQFSRQDFNFAQRLFAILDTESQGFITQRTVQEFTVLRCPVFSRRDEDLRKLSVYSSTGNVTETASASSLHNKATSTQTSPTFTEIWNTVCACAKGGETTLTATRMGVEGWLVFCRFIALAQYLEAKRRFSARHLQQTMRHRNAPRGSEVVVVDVPPPQPPTPLTLEALVECEQRAGAPLPVPELDLDHSLLAVHDTGSRQGAGTPRGTVHVQLIGQTGPLLGRLGTTSGSSSQSTPLDFAISYAKDGMSNPSVDSSSTIVVRRSMADLKWLDESFATQKVLGGTLCGRILPSFPPTAKSSATHLLGSDDSSSTGSLLTHTTKKTFKVAKKGLGKIGDAAKSILGSTMQVGSMLVTSTATPPLLMDEASTASDSASTHNSAVTPSVNSVTRATNTKPPRRPAGGVHASSSSSSTSLENFYNAQAPATKARQLERYLNYLLEHPALSTSFPLNTILMVRLDMLSFLF